MLPMLILLLAQSTAPTSPVTSMTLTPHPVAQLDLDKLKGVPRNLAWSPDGDQLYFENCELNSDALPKACHHHLITIASGKLANVEAAPAWATAYWDWKSGHAAPGDGDWQIDLSTEERTRDIIGTSMGGNMVRGAADSGATGISTSEAAAAAQQRYTQSVRTMRLNGQVVGQWIDQPIVPGLTFGWGPAGSNLIAYADDDGGHLTIMDKAGHRTRVDDAKDVVLPAWSPDLARLAYLQKTDKNRYTVVVATVK